MRKTVILALLLSGTAIPASAEGISGVVLSSGGLAEITRTVKSTEGDGSFAVRRGHLDDVLKSIVVRDTAGAPTGLRLDGPTRAAEAFENLPFGPEDVASLPTLLGKLAGEEVEVIGGAGRMSGRIVGVSTDIENKAHVLTLSHGEGQVSGFVLDAGTAVTFADAEIARGIEAAAAIGTSERASGVRTVSVDLAPGADREVSLSYVVPAPVWKASHRLTIGEDDRARLETWAVVENATGEPWKNVDLALSSGSPRTLHQSLYEHAWAGRETVEAVPYRPMARNGAVMAMSADVSAEFAAAPPAVAKVEVAAEDNEIASIYRFPQPIDLEAGTTLTAPIVDRSVDAERVSIYRTWEQGRHPMHAVSFTNDSGAALPKGIVTVYDARTGYVGDATLEIVPDGAKAAAVFAGDTAVATETQRRPRSQIASVTVADGAATVVTEVFDTTIIRFRNEAPEARTVVVEHRPANPDAVRSAAEFTKEGGIVRFRVAVEADSEASIDIVETVRSTSTIGIAETSDALLATWRDATPDAETRERIDELTQGRARLREAREELDVARGRLEAIVSDQERVRGNLGALPADSELAARYLGTLSGQEDEIADLRGVIDTAENAVARLEREVGEIISSF